MIVEDGRLPEEPREALDGIDLTGFADNYWVGLSMLHTLVRQGAQRDRRPPRVGTTRHGTTSSSS